MIKPKHLITKQKNTTTRKPSLPIKRNSSIQSNISDQSCMSDRIIYKKNLGDEQFGGRGLDGIEAKKYMTNSVEEDKMGMIGS